MSTKKLNKPTGIKILAGIQFAYAGFVFAMIFGIGYIISSIPMMNLGSTVGITTIISGILAIAGVLAIIMGIGLFTGKRWARTLVRILSAIELIFAILSLNVIGIVLYGFILYYMGQPHVKSYFGGEIALHETENDSLQVLKNRLAKGEITQEEYEDIKKTLD